MVHQPAPAACGTVTCFNAWGQMIPSDLNMCRGEVGKFCVVHPEIICCSAGRLDGMALSSVVQLRKECVGGEMVRISLLVIVAGDDILWKSGRICRPMTHT